MGGIGWTELVMIGVVALIVIGPKDLPEMFRTLGRFTAKIRSMGREFQRAMDAAATESGVKDVAKDLKSATSAQSLGLTAVKEAAAKFEKWDPLKNAARPTTPVAKPVVAEPVIAAPAPIAAPVAETGRPMGPATQALAAQKAAKQAIAREAAEKMRAVTAPAEAMPSPPPEKKPRAPRKKAAR